MEDKLYEERKEMLKKTIIGKTCFKVMEVLIKISDAIQRFLTK